jgi:type III pantothenate kinase
MAHGKKLRSDEATQLLLLDIGNTHTHAGLHGPGGRIRHRDLKTADWFTGRIRSALESFAGRKIRGAALCSVVPKATAVALQMLKKTFGTDPLELTSETVRGVGIRYPEPETIGPDRLANAVAVHCKFGAPAVVVDFGTAVTFDVVDEGGNYVGGIIAPGLSAMTDYLHEKTALLPRIKIRPIRRVIGKNTEQAMLIGAVHGYRGLIRGLLEGLKEELKCADLPVVATGGCAKLIAAGMPEITSVQPLLTLEGLRIVWEAHRGGEGSRLHSPARKKQQAGAG